MQYSILDKNQWKSFFDYVSDYTKGQHILLEVASVEKGDQVIEEWAPIESFSYDTKNNKFHVQAQKFIDHLIAEPLMVVIGEKEDGICSINIKDARDEIQVVQFRKPLLLHDGKRKKQGSCNHLKPGTKAPNFNLPSTPDQKVSLSEFLGRPVVLVFYPADWSPVCGDQLSLYNEIMSEFKKYDATVLAISADNIWSHLAYKNEKKLHFALLSDFEPKGKVAKDYGVYDENSGVCGRSLFLIDPKGMIYWSYLSPIGINPGADGILEALESLSQKQMEAPL